MQSVYLNCKCVIVGIWRPIYHLGHKVGIMYKSTLLQIVNGNGKVSNMSFILVFPIMSEN